MAEPEQIRGGEQTLEQRVDRIEKFVADFALGASISDVPVYLFEGGRMAQPQTDGAVGYDCYARAIVDRESKPTVDNPLRRTRADFIRSPGWRESVDEDIQEWIVRDPIRQDRYGIALPPGERCMVGLGFATAMSLPMFYFVLPRSGHASIGVNLDNSPGTVDPDYRGEAGALITNRSKEPFVITRDTRIIQAVFMLAIMPQLVQVDSRDDLPVSLRGVGGFGSTGVHG
jgi:dUTP pyrophosphatase